MKRTDLISEIVEDLASFKRVMIASHAANAPTHMPTPAQIGILGLIARGGAQNLKDLAARLRMSSSAATQLVDGLVEERMLTRTEDPADRRRILLALTASGRRKLDQAKKRRMDSFAKLLAPLTESELVDWKRLQRKIIGHAS